MKKALTIGGIIIFFVILLALLVARLFFPHSASPAESQASDPFASLPAPTVTIQTDTPEHALSTCYSWYLQVYSHETVTADAIMQRPELASCFTQDFLGTWEARRTSVEADPVLLTQDFQTSWQSAPPSVSIVGQSVRSEDAQVTIGTGASQIQVIAHVVRDGDAWKISLVSPAS